MILKEQQQQALASKKRKADVGDAILIQAQKESAVVVGKRAPMPSKDLQLAWQNAATILSEGKNTSKSQKRTIEEKKEVN